MSKPLTEISPQEFDNRIGSLVGGLFIFYLLLSGNFTGELLNCQFQNILRNSIIVKHVVGFCMLYFFVYLTSTNVNWNAGIKLGFTMLLFIFFILSNRCDGYIVLTNIILLAIIYIMQQARDTDQTTVDNENSSEDDKKTATENINSIRIVQIITTVIIFILTLLGFILYIGRRKLEFGQQFKFSELLFSKAECANDAGERYTYMKMFTAAFQPPPVYKQILDMDGSLINFSPKSISPSALRPVTLTPASLSRKSNELSTLLDSELIRKQLHALQKTEYKRAVVPTYNVAIVNNNATPNTNVSSTAPLLVPPDTSTGSMVLGTLRGRRDAAANLLGDSNL